MLKKLLILILLLISITSSPVLAKESGIVLLNDVEPLKVDSSYKQAKFIQENGKILKREKIKIEQNKVPEVKNVKSENPKTKASTEQSRVTPEITKSTTEKEENKAKTPTVEAKSKTAKPEGVTIVPENGKTLDTEQASPAPTTTKEVVESTKPENPKLSVDQVKELIVKYSQKYSVDLELMLKIADCESGFKTDLIGSGRYFGVFQFSKPTFNESATILNFQNPDPLNPDQNIEMAAYLISEGQAWRWGCK